MKTNKTIKWLLAVVLVAVIAGCDGSGSGKSGSNDGSAAGLDMLDLTTVDQEALAKTIHENLTKFAASCSVAAMRTRGAKMSTKKYKENLESGPCEYGGSMNVIENVEYNTAEKQGHSLEVSYDHCKMIGPDDNFIDGYEKNYELFTTEGDIAAGRAVYIYKNFGRTEDYICTVDGFKGESLEVTTRRDSVGGSYEYYKYSVESKVTKWGSTGGTPAIEIGYDILFNISGYKDIAGGLLHIKADAIIETPNDKGCRTDGVVHLTGKNNSKVTIQYNADRSMDFTLNGKTEHWYSCMQKNP